MSLLELLIQKTVGQARMRHLIPELQSQEILNLNNIGVAINIKNFAIRLWMYNYDSR